MKRIDLMSKEEIVKMLSRVDESFDGCSNCPAKDECTDGDYYRCLESIHNYLFEEVEMVQRASLYKTKEEAFEKFFGDGLYEYCKEDILEFANFLMEKVPKPIDKSEEV